MCGGACARFVAASVGAGPGCSPPAMASRPPPTETAAAAAASGIDRQRSGMGILSALHSPTPASPFVLAGTSNGSLLLWQVWLEQQQQQQLPALAAADGDWPSSSTTTTTPGGVSVVRRGCVELPAPHVTLALVSTAELGGTSFGGVTVAVALCTSAGYAAAAVTCGQVRVTAAAGWVVHVSVLACLLADRHLLSSCTPFH